MKESQCVAQNINHGLLQVWLYYGLSSKVHHNKMTYDIRIVQRTRVDNEL